MKAQFTAMAAVGFALSLGACDVEQTKEANLPEVEVKGGNLPEYDVDAPDVDVTTETRTVEVPVIDVDEADAGQPGER